MWSRMLYPLIPIIRDSLLRNSDDWYRYGVILLYPNLSDDLQTALYGRDCSLIIPT